MLIEVVSDYRLCVRQPGPFLYVHTLCLLRLKFLFLLLPPCCADALVLSGVSVSRFGLKYPLQSPRSKAEMVQLLL